MNLSVPSENIKSPLINFVSFSVCLIALLLSPVNKRFIFSSFLFVGIGQLPKRFCSVALALIKIILHKQSKLAAS